MVNTMTRKTFLNALDDDRIIAAIGEAEKRSSGEIRVYVSSKSVADAVAAAQAEFLRLGMEKTRDRNGVLIFIAPQSRAFAIVGDLAIHQRCGDLFWTEVAGTMETHLKNSRYTDALLAAIARVGAILAEHFPRSTDDVNELPDQITGD
jgi:uncharacterized membrane protein